MESYTQRPSASSEDETTSRTTPRPPCGGGVDAPLVNTFISQQSSKSRNPVKSLQVYHRAVKLVRVFPGNPDQKPPTVRAEIQSFSDASKRRLRFAALNAFPALVSQFGMTYHNGDPDGRTCKKHLNAFLVAMRRKFPGVGFLWLLEFQKRGTAHFHLFTTLEHNRETGKILGKIWNRIAEPGNGQHLAFHQHPRNFIPWEMESAGYLCKYLDKEAQKAVPVGFSGVGRFWGNSRGLVPAPSEIEMGELREFCGVYSVTHLVRTLCRHHEASLRHSKWKSRARRAATSYTLQNGSRIVRRMLSEYERQRPVSPPPF